MCFAFMSSLTYEDQKSCSWFRGNPVSDFNFQFTANS